MSVPKPITSQSSFRLAILTGSDSPATQDCIRRIVDLPGVEIAAVIYDRGVLPWKFRLRRMWKRAQIEGVVNFLSLRFMELAANLAHQTFVWPYDPTAIRRAVFPEETRSIEELCRRRSVPYIVVDSLNNRSAQVQLTSLQVDLGVVIGTRILQAATFTIPKLGSINLHKGQVPRYRGMPPAFWELYNGEKEAGVTVHFVIEKLDAGPIVAEGSVPIGTHETEHSLRMKLDELGSRLLGEAVEALATGRAVPRAQPPADGRAYTSPTSQQRSILARRLTTLPEPTSKRLLKHALYVFLLFGGPIVLRNLWLRLRRRTRYTVLLYHRVNDLSKDKLTITIDRFIHHLTILRRYYTVVSLNDAVEASRKGRFLGPNAVVITFDDGYADNAEIAAPILRHFKIPATFFVATGMMGTNRPFPHDLTSPYTFANMTWQQICCLKAHGFEVGAHGWSHANLAKCSLGEARQEISQSREILEQMLGNPVKSFAYPYGGRKDITPEVVSEILKAGFQVIASAYGGANVGSIDAYSVSRTSVNDMIDALALRAHVEGIALNTLGEMAMNWLRIGTVSRSSQVPVPKRSNI